MIYEFKLLCWNIPVLANPQSHEAGHWTPTADYSILSFFSSEPIPLFAIRCFATKKVEELIEKMYLRICSIVKRIKKQILPPLDAMLLS